jgi:hypothetical protein
MTITLLIFSYGISSFYEGQTASRPPGPAVDMVGYLQLLRARTEDGWVGALSR